MSKITFKFENGDVNEVFANEGEQILDLAKKANVVIDAPCSGNVSCGKCKVKLLEGSVKSEITRHITEEEYADGWRLACNSEVDGDAVIGVPDIASAFKNRMKVADLSTGEEVKIFNKTIEDIKATGIKVGNDMEILEIELAEPTLDDTTPDNTRLTDAIREKYHVSFVTLSYNVLKDLSSVLRENNFKVKCVVGLKNDRTVVYRICSPDDDPILGGLAVDIGTTTVSALLVDMKDGKILSKASAGNGQIRYGADVINRIIEAEKPGGKEKLQSAIIDETIKPLIQNMCTHANIDPINIYRMTVSANTTMNHLFAGVDAGSIRMEPYIPVFYTTMALHGGNLNLGIHPDAKIIITPNVGSYVGGDITSGVLANTMWNSEELTLFVDLGTNGELVFGSSDFLMTCACSAGPAFEGGDISCGMRATDGAIEACEIDEETMEPTFKIVGEEGTKPIGLCGSGLIDVIAELFRCKIINPKGKFVREGERIRHDKFGMGSYVLAFKEDAGSVKDVEINEVDIDNFIRAKGAIFSAINLMLSSLDFDPSVLDRVFVAGGIGSGINMENTIRIGMFPNIPVEKYFYIGNSSLSGAYATLVSNEAEEKVYEIGRGMTYMELSTNPSYMDEFVAACFIPHTNSALFQ
ncbi:Uncharacterized 2Fe-2 and 4Fe-4S clusters-containing protein, contains DUF4445 domain [Acetitomaculum ruminis DSM 5522]|uniref:Uncharacterized 2Fe-2 and 4Fe-4S clusters-containing protein, contains DUF4445 domain n=1 Tax=Acetitomaculum ruminis DSM 5522 TaxID=1120918 RepID=A0A1I0XLC6_9FIRM|nr:corrinoid activation/regeneration protein AcsV [Acetitomaculum ruminis]SFB01801.1 Uncharacterized 2Fe-2 and 4Fe-4S clusters-containing protein, contains DUF4445 domain [Acetitomaculum ruminis DSM 5522]